MAAIHIFEHFSTRDVVGSSLQTLGVFPCIHCLRLINHTRFRPLLLMKLSLLPLLLAVVTSSASGVVLFSDTFDTADSASFDAAPHAGRTSGLVAGETYLRSWGSQQQISNNQLFIPLRNSGGVRFENALNDPTSGAADRYNWAGGAAAAAMIAGNGFTVTFDWIPVEITLGDWVSFQVGVINADTNNLTHAETDYGILFRNNGGTERFDNGVNLGAGGSFTSTAGGVHHIQITYSFNSFADGTAVNAVSKVNGVEVANDNFTWNNNSGELRFELGSISANSRIDNLTITTIPEPSAAVALLAGLAGFGFRRRRL